MDTQDTRKRVQDQAQEAQTRADALYNARQGTSGAAPAAGTSVAGTPAASSPSAAQRSQAGQRLSGTDAAASSALSAAQGARTADAAAYAELAARAQQSAQNNRLQNPDLSGLRAMTDQWQENAVRQATGQIENAVRQGTTDLTRARDDAYRQYQQQLRQIDVEESRARDNQALYNAAQGDRGGIGSAQMDRVAIAAAQNRQSVRQAQTNLSRDIARQIADLRAQGQFKKADTILEIAQSALAQLKEIETFGIQTGLTVQQFNANMDQWLVSTLAQLNEQQVQAGQWAQNLAFQRERAAVSDAQWLEQFNANRSDTAWSQNFQQNRADVSDQQWREQFDANREDTKWNQAWQRERADVSDQQWQSQFDANRADTAWSQAYQQDRANVSDQQWREQFDANRSDTAWSQNFQQNRADVSDQQWREQFDANRADTAWNQAYQQNRASVSDQQWREQFDANRSDTAWSQAYQANRAAASDAQSAQSEARTVATNMLNAGILPDADTLRQAGINSASAQSWVNTVNEARQLQADQTRANIDATRASAASKTTTAGAASGNAASASSGAPDMNGLFREAYSQQVPKNFITSKDNYSRYGFSGSTGLTAAYDEWAADKDNLLTHPPAPDSYGPDAGKKRSIGDSIPLYYSPKTGEIVVNGKSFTGSGAEPYNKAAEYIQKLALTMSEQQAENLMNSMRRIPGLATAFGLN